MRSREGLMPSSSLSSSPFSSSSPTSVVLADFDEKVEDFWVCNLNGKSQAECRSRIWRRLDQSPISRSVHPTLKISKLLRNDSRELPKDDGWRYRSASSSDFRGSVIS